MKNFQKFRKVVDTVLNAMIIVLFLVMFGVTTVNVFMRYVLNRPLSFAVELGRYTFAAIVYLGSIFVMRDDGHIGLDIIVEMLPRRVQKVVKALTRILVLAYLALFTTMAGRMVRTNWKNRSSTMRIPMSIVYIVMVIGGVGMFIEEFLLLIGVNKGKQQDVTEAGGGM